MTDKQKERRKESLITLSLLALFQINILLFAHVLHLYQSALERIK